MSSLPQNQNDDSNPESSEVSESEEESDDSSEATRAKKRVSVKDFAVLVTIATIAASGLVTAVFGYGALVEKCHKLDLRDILLTLLIFVVLIGTFTYILLRVAFHYIVYVGIGTLIHLIFPVDPHKAREHLKRLYNKDKTK